VTVQLPPDVIAKKVPYIYIYLYIRWLKQFVYTHTKFVDQLCSYNMILSLY